MNSMIAVNRFAGGGVAVLGEDFTDRDLEPPCSDERGPISSLRQGSAFS
jgi:hypothetical protein